MKVLFQNRPKDLWIGGDMIQLEKTMEALAKKGIEVEFNDQGIYTPALRYRSFDIIHLFNFSMQWTRSQLYIARMHKKPVVCSMIYHESDQFVPYKHQQIMIDHIDSAIFLAPTELERVKRHLKIKDEIVSYIPNGIDKMFFKKVQRSVDIPRFALTVGRIEPHKGQLHVAQACKELGITYICIGERSDQDYARLCEKAGAFIEKPKTPEQLIKFYAQCAVYVLASRAEVMPLTVMEAGAQGKNIVLTDHCEYDFPNTVSCEYGNKESIKKSIQEALKKPYNQVLEDQLREMTWDKVADQLINIYKKLV